MSITDDQKKIMATMEMVSGILSFTASSIMAFSILHSRRKLSFTFHRLLMALCVSDIISSLALCLSSVPSPEETGIWLASGTTATCSIQAFFKTFGIVATPLYNCAVCVHYLLIIRYNKSDEFIQKKVEPYLLVVPFLWAVGLGSHLWIRENFNPHYASCYVVDYPYNCTNDPEVVCLRGEDAWTDPFYRFSSFVIFFVVPITIVTSLTLIHKAVLRREERSNRFGRGSLNLQTESVISNASPRRSRSTTSLSRESLTQLIAYTVAWLIPNMWIVVILLIKIFIDDSPPVLIRMCFHFFYPIQGLFNLIAYMVPRFFRTRNQHPEYSIKEALAVVLNLRQSEDDLEDGTTMRGRRGSAMRRRSSLIRQPTVLQEEPAEEQGVHLEEDAKRTMIHHVLDDFCGGGNSVKDDASNDRNNLEWNPDQEAGNCITNDTI